MCVRAYTYVRMFTCVFMNAVALRFAPGVRLCVREREKKKELENE